MIRGWDACACGVRPALQQSHLSVVMSSQLGSSSQIKDKKTCRKAALHPIKHQAQNTNAKLNCDTLLKFAAPLAAGNKAREKEALSVQRGVDVERGWLGRGLSGGGRSIGKAAEIGRVD